MESRTRLSGWLGLAALLALAIGLTFTLNFLRGSPETAPASTSATFPPSPPPAANLSYPGPTANPTITPTPQELPPTYPDPDETPGVVYQVPPPCQADPEWIPAAAPTGASTWQDYTFSAPRAISNTSDLIEIIQLLPDSGRLLLLMGDENGELIETLDITTGETHRYARNLENPGLIRWAPEDEAVAYTDRKQQAGVVQSPLVLSTSLTETRVLLDQFDYIGDGRPTPAVELPNSLRQFLYPVFPFDPETWKYPKFDRDQTLVWRRMQHRAALSLDGSRIAFYDAPWLLIVDARTGQPCEIDLFPHAVRAVQAKWNSNSRYLALLTTDGYPGDLMHYGHVAIFDRKTGQAAHMKEIHYINKLDWLPSGDALLILGSSDVSRTDERFYLLPANEMKLYPVLAEGLFWNTISRGPDHILSPDGKFVAVECSNGDLCILSVASDP